MNNVEKTEVSGKCRKDNRSLRCWLREHKKELVITGMSVTTLLILALNVKDEEISEKVWHMSKENITIPAKEEMPTIIEKISNTENNVIPMHREDGLPFEVGTHVRNLHEGWKASKEKLQKAAEAGIHLEPGQTLVESYMKGRVA
ncbi:hypothetical protein DXB23_01570 [Dorea sp. OM02-2LB]|nr:hypothetical protein DXB23_01570 [Dorea sp. OM02-2LB]